MNLKKIIVLFTLIAFANIGIAQNNIVTYTIRFTTGKSKVEQTDTKFNEFITSIKKFDSIAVSVEGNTDNTGSYRINKKLSGIRANAVAQYLVKNGIDESFITIKALASKHPVASNKTRKGRSLNRRVDIVVHYFTKQKHEASTSSIKQPEQTKQEKQVESIHELYKQLATPKESFCVNPNKDTVLRCAKGTIIYIKANSIVTNSNTGSCVQFNVKEDFLKSDMVLDNLSTTSNGEILETQGMIYTEALDNKGNKLELTKGKDMVIMLQTDTIRSDAKIFDGQREHDSVMNWIANNNSIISNSNLKKLNYCDSLNCLRNCLGNYTCPNCKFFFCRIFRLDNFIGGLFSNNVRESNIKFRNCEKTKDSIQKAISIIMLNPPFLNNRFDGKANINSCEDLEKMFKEYGVDNYKDLVDAINKRLFKIYKVDNLKDLEIAMFNERRNQIDSIYQNGKVKLDDLQYYIFNSPKFGWANCDYFLSYNKNRLIDVNTNLRIAKNVDCKLVFKKRKIALPYFFKGDSDYYNFKTIKDEEAWLVCLKIENGIPYLSMQEITTAAKTFEVEFKQYTLEQLKQELKKLD